MTLKGKVSGKISSASKHADMLGALLGYFGTFAAVGQAENVSFVQEIMYRHVNALTIHNVGKLETDFIPTIAGVNTPEWSALFRTGIIALIGGVVVGELPSIVPWQKSAASIAKKGGFGLMIGAAAATAVGKLAEGSGGGTQIGGSGSSSSSGGGVSTTGMVTRVRGDFAPPTPYSGVWARPS